MTAIKNNLHVNNISTTLTFDNKGNIEQISDVATDLHLDALDKLHDTKE